MIYLDNNATTKIDPRVVESMMPYLTDLYANPASNHEFGVQVNREIKASRENLSHLLGCESNEIVFTSGATEAINLALKGLADVYSKKGKHIVTVSTEHPAMLDTCKYLEEIGFEVTYLSVNSSGLIDLNMLNDSLRSDTILVSVMMVNNETGVIQPLKEISALSHSLEIPFMTDATQAVGKIPINVDELGIDLLTFSGHKFYGPKGVGGLFVRSRKPFKVKLGALLHGGGHERGLRSGTLNVPGIIGIGKAAEIAHREMATDAKRVELLRNQLERNLLTIDNTFVNGDTKKRLYNTSSICFKGADADAIMVDLNDIMVSNGSACTSSKSEPSHVLRALGRTDEEAYSSIRFSLGKFTTDKDIAYVTKKTSEVVGKVRSMTGEYQLQKSRD